jgi:meiotic recombination protein DMC1
VGGHILAHQVHTRVMLRKGSGEQRIAKLVSSSRMPERDGTFRLFDGGVGDAE